MAGSDTIRIWHQDIPEGVQIRQQDFDPKVHRKHGEPAPGSVVAPDTAPTVISVDDEG